MKLLLLACFLGLVAVSTGKPYWNYPMIWDNDFQENDDDVDMRKKRDADDFDEDARDLTRSADDDDSGSEEDMEDFDAEAEEQDMDSESFENDEDSDAYGDPTIF